MRNLIFEETDVRAPEYASSHLRYAWESIRAPVIIPLLKLAVILCSTMSIMLFVERVVMATICAIVKVLGKKKYRKYNLDVMKQKLSSKNCNLCFQVYKLSIGAVCGLSWPSDRLIVQVLDDSTNPVLRRVSLFKRLHLIYAFFFVRKIVAHWVTFFFYCIVIPACVIVPEVQLTKKIAIYIPAAITILNAISTPRSLHLLVCWILFENVMSLHRTKAAIIGLLEANRVNEWVVTEKLGNAKKQKNNARSPTSRISWFQILERY